MLTLYLARHGQTDANAEGRVQGRGLDPDLNALGRWQAERLADRLADVRLDAAYTSTQKRAHQTAAPVVARHPGIPETALPGLDEMDWGDHEGRASTPDMTADYEALVAAWTRGETDVRVPGGESPHEVEVRVREALGEIVAAHPSGAVLIVSHRRLMRILLASLLPGGGLERMQSLPTDNAALNVLDVEPDGHGGFSSVTVRALNDTTHLTDTTPVSGVQT